MELPALVVEMNVSRLLFVLNGGAAVVLNCFFQSRARRFMAKNVLFVSGSVYMWLPCCESFGYGFFCWKSIFTVYKEVVGSRDWIVLRVHTFLLFFTLDTLFGDEFSLVMFWFRGIILQLTTKYVWVGPIGVWEYQVLKLILYKLQMKGSLLWALDI